MRTRAGRLIASLLVAGATVAAGAGARPAAAAARDDGESVTLTASATSVKVGDSVTFSGGGSATETFFSYTIAVIVLPQTTPAITSCPASYEDTMRQGTVLYGEPGPGTGGGPYTYATSGVTLNSSGTRVVCAYLENEDTYAVSAPVTVTVAAPAAPPRGTPATGTFGGPKRSSRPTTLSVRPEHTLRSPGINVIDVGGYVPSDATASLILTLKNTAAYNGCGSNDTVDGQLTRASGGSTLAYYEKIDTGARGTVSVPVILTLHKRIVGTYVLCAYAHAGYDDDVAVGSYRFTMKAPAKPPARR